MVNRSGSAKAILLIVLLATTLSAQQPPEGDPFGVKQADAQKRASLAKDWLSTSDPQRVAWGAYIARTDHLVSLTPLLVEHVSHYQAAFSPDGTYVEPKNKDQYDAMMVVLDALIELGKNVPAEQVRKLYPEFSAQSLILLIHSSDEASVHALLDIFRITRWDEEWLAAGNVLARAPQPGFTALLLSRFTQRLAVTVVDAKTHIGGGNGSSVCGDAFPQPKAGWPPVGLYELSLKADYAGEVVLSPGKNPVFYMRGENGLYAQTGSCSSGESQRDNYRRQYLAELAGARVLKDLRPIQIKIDWQDAQDFQQRVAEAIAQQREGFHHVVSRLLACKYLSSEEAGTLKPRIEVVVTDERGDRSTRLPKMTSAEPLVAFRRDFSKPLY